MELEHSFTVPVPMDRAWDVLLDVERVAPCMPGATLDSVEGDEIRGRIKVKVGPINMTYAGTARFVERDKASGVVRLEASGKETRGAGTASATVRSVLEDHGAETSVVVLTTLNVTGKPAQFGRGVLNEVGGRLLSIFAANLATTLAESDGGAAAASGPAEPAKPAKPAAAEPVAPGQVAPEPVAPEPAAAAGAPAHTGALAAQVDELGLPTRVTSSLHREGITTIGQLVGKTREELRAIDGIGRASVDDINAKLAERGLTLGEPPAVPAGAVPAQPTGAAVAAADTAAAHGATASSAKPEQASARAVAQHLEDDALNLIKVAGMPVLKRALPVLAGLTAVALIGIRKRMRRRSRN